MVNKDITRVKEWKKLKDLSEQEFEQIANESVLERIKKNDPYINFRDFAIEEVYAKDGEIGEVIEVFLPNSTSGYGDRTKVWSAKVKINNQIKTFRLTSLNIIKQ